MNNISQKKNKTAKLQTEPKAQDLKPNKDAKGGVLIGLLLPAVQKVRGP